MTELWTPMAFTAKEAENHGGHYVAAIGSSSQESRSIRLAPR